jgi:UDP:flavonoid glycosyltransferase YjiC (YdhE family)
MATVLLIWEQGGGLGHLMHLKPLAEALSRQGHRVLCAARDLSSARAVFGRSRISLLQAPVKIAAPVNLIRPTFTLAHILHNIGFGDAEELAAMVEAWRCLYELVQADLIIFNHSPTALLAARGLVVKRALIGTGFTIPPDVSPLPNLGTWLQPDIGQLLRNEQRILDIMNDVLQLFRLPHLTRITQIYSEVDESFLMTFPELDHHPGRTQARYWGTFDTSAGEEPTWPASRGKRIYAYIKPFNGLPAILHLLKDLQHPTLAFIQPLDASLRAGFESDTLRITSRPLNLSRAARECDLAILNGTHASTLTLLLAGKPVLQLPHFLEQMILAKKVAALGMGLEADQANIHDVAAKLQQLLALDQYGAAAKAFSESHCGTDAAATLQQVLHAVEHLLEPR